MGDLNQLVQNMQPCLHKGIFAYCKLAKGQPVPEGAIFWFAEFEGISVIVPIKIAKKVGLPIGFQAEWITLEVHSDLSSVGLTAAVSTALAKAGISCNIVAGYHHDHLFVPAGTGAMTIEVLELLNQQGHSGA